MSKMHDESARARLRALRLLLFRFSESSSSSLLLFRPSVVRPRTTMHVCFVRSSLHTTWDDHPRSEHHGAANAVVVMVLFRIRGYFAPLSYYHRLLLSAQTIPAA